jgi:hypothetical protein
VGKPAYHQSLHTIRMITTIVVFVSHFISLTCAFSGFSVAPFPRFPLADSFDPAIENTTFSTDLEARLACGTGCNDGTCCATFSEICVSFFHGLSHAYTAL